MQRLVIIGAGSHARSVAEAASASGGFELVGFLDDAFPQLVNVWNLPVLGGTNDIFKCQMFVDVAIVAIGNNELREAQCKQLCEAGLELVTVVHPRAIVSPSAVIAAGCAIMAGAIVGTEAQLGKCVIVNSGAVVDHHCQVDDFGHLGVHAAMAGGLYWGMAPGCKQVLYWDME